MAERSDGESNWWNSWLTVAKEKSAQTLQILKNDLAEFGAVCAHEASHVVASTSGTLQETIQSDGATNKVKQGFISVFGNISKVLTVPHDDDGEDDMLRVTSYGSFEVFDKFKARLYELQTSAQTFCNEPDGLREHFDDWLQGFDLESKNGEISELLVSRSEVRGIYTKLVPSAVSHKDFWERYFYKVYQLEQDERRRKELKNRAEKTRHDPEQLWDDDWMGATSSNHNQPPVLEKSESTTALAIDSFTKFSDDIQQTETGVALPVVCASNAATEHTAQANPISDTLKLDDHGMSSHTANELPVDETVLHSDFPRTCDTTKDSASLSVKEKGGYILVGSDRQTPSSSIGSSNSKDDCNLNDQWEKEFEVTGDDLKAVEEMAKALDDTGKADIEDWESWE